MVKFEAPEHTKGPLAGYQVVGCWRTTARDPEWRGEVGTEQYEYMHHYERASDRQLGVDPAGAVAAALREWRDWRVPDHVEVDAVYESSLSRPAGSQRDPFIGLEGTGHDGYDPSGKSKQRGKVGE